MLGEELFEIWAPQGATWSPWAKPVLFAQLHLTPSGASIGQWWSRPVDWAPPVDQRLAIVVDLPDALSIEIGLALAGRGYRPVPLYNCCTGPNPVLDVSRIQAGLIAGGGALSGVDWPVDPPPVFLLDSRRKRSLGRLSPGMFDNRWVVLPQDFPSANMLKAHGITGVLLVQEHPGQPQNDLAHVLRRWQEAGLPISTVALVVAPASGTPGMAPILLAPKPTPINIARPRLFGSIFYTLLATLGLRRSSAGGFGSVIPQPSSSGRAYG